MSLVHGGGKDSSGLTPQLIYRMKTQRNGKLTLVDDGIARGALHEEAIRRHDL